MHKVDVNQNRGLAAVAQSCSFLPVILHGARCGLKQEAVTLKGKVKVKDGYGVQGKVRMVIKNGQ